MAAIRATGWRQAGVFAADIKLAHTVFALPFAVLGAALACGWAQRVPAWGEAVLVLACMVLARTFAMGVNRLADAAIDAANPRTAGRALASGRLSRGFVGGAVTSCGAGFVVAAAGFGWGYGNWWPTALALPVLGLLAVYSYTKRFTWLCHAVLGLALAVSPLAAALALEPGYLAASPAGWLLAAVVLGWVAGFDVIYALGDVAFDRGRGLFSMPASLGEERALWVSRGLHAAALLCLAGTWAASPRLGMWFLAAVVVTGGLLVLEHALVWRSNTNRLDVAFFTVNGVISVVLGVAGLGDVLRLSA
ncbi:MAG: UbiA-like polyprenyltransferase [Planctomycetota bacterium]